MLLTDAIANARRDLRHWQRIHETKEHPHSFMAMCRAQDRLDNLIDMQRRGRTCVVEVTR